MNAQPTEPHEIAVVIPTYNRADLIGATLDSLLAQTYHPKEIVVVDDGSTDETEAIVARYGPRVRYHRIENGGVCRARNVGVALSSAPWVAFCDSDDLWQPEKLAWQVRLLQRAPEIEYVFSDFVIVGTQRWETVSKFRQAPPGFWESGRRTIDQALWVFDEPLYARILRFQPIFMSTPVMSRRLFDRVGGFNESFGRKKSEDLEFTLRCQQHAPVGAVARPIVGIRKHTGNRSGNYLKTLLGQLEILQHARLYHRPHGELYASIIDDELASRCTSALAVAFAAGQFEAVRTLARMVRQPRAPLKLQLKVGLSHMPNCVAGPLAALCMLASRTFRAVEIC